VNIAGAWLLVIFVWAVLLAFWLWLGKVFDVIDEYHHTYRNAAQKDGEDAQATEGTGS